MYNVCNNLVLLCKNNSQGCRTAWTFNVKIVQSAYKHQDSCHKCDDCKKLCDQCHKYIRFSEWEEHAKTCIRHDFESDEAEDGINIINGNNRRGCCSR